ncbi:MAG: hypothetical protein RMX68_025170 [Aulosira sp. ZfuVER01]|nr:hypothetical protein [Aulosira sp. ZfuVER01]MDZ7999396.1 hypothetical protein [Aulosira sp. DedVER01a]MDZ8055419.1 hypothetical protein [Aulosira sp. ZfuCHP01]
MADADISTASVVLSDRNYIKINTIERIRSVVNQVTTSMSKGKRGKA